MRKKGFTYIELMIAISIFTLLILMVMKLNMISQGNLTKQINSQKMMLVAQKQLEKYKSSQLDGNSIFTLVDGYYVQLISDNKPGGNIYKVTINIRRDPSSNEGEVILQSHVIKD